MSLHRYYGIKRFTQEAVDAHAVGKPFNPSGCRGSLSVFYHNDEQTSDFKGVDMSFGTSIRAMSLPEYVYTLNLLLDKGAVINVASATALGIIIQCSYTLEANDESTNTKPQVEDHPIRGQTPEKAFVDETTESSESSTDLSEPEQNTTENESRILPDWDYAESLKEDVSKSDAKKALEFYAHGFGVKLSRKLKFEDMMKNFHVEMED